MKRAVALFAACTIVFLLCSCTAQKKSAEFKVGTEDEVESLDTLKAEGDAEIIMAVNCFEGLFGFDKDGNVDLTGATGYSVSKDALTYTFSLNPDAVWYVSEASKAIIDSSGKEFDSAVTADDYMFAIKRAIAEKAQGYEELLYINGADKYNPDSKDSDIAGLKASDKYTLEITLKEPHSDIISSLASPITYPVSEAFYNIAGSVYGTTASTVLCNGVYCISDFSKAGTLVLTQNPEYRGKTELMNKSVTIYAAGKSDSVKSRFEDGAYDVYLTNSTDKSVAVNSSIYSSEYAVWGVVANCSHKIMQNENLRKALIYSIGYPGIKTPSFSAGKATSAIPASYIVTTDKYSAHAAEDFTLREDENKADKYMTKALAELKTTSVKITVIVPEVLYPSFKSITNNWNKLFNGNIETVTKSFEGTDPSETISDNEYDIAVLPLYSDKSFALSLLESVENSPCSYQNKKYSSLLEKAANAANDTEKAAALDNAQRYLATAGVFVPLFIETRDLYLAENVSGVYCAGGKNMIYFASGIINEK